MNGASETNAASAAKDSLARRDWLLLPLLSLLTLCAILALLEGIGSYLFPRPGTALLQCLVLNDASTGPRGIPGCVSTVGLPEGRPVEYRFNRCGHRAGMECRDKPAGTYRIVMVGSSFAFGYGIQQDRTFAALLPKKLSQATGHPIELYDEGLDWETPHVIVKRFGDVLAARPDMILWIVTSWDVARPPDAMPHFDKPVTASVKTPQQSKLRGLYRIERARIAAAFAHQSFSAAISDLWQQTRTAVLLEHLLYQSRSQYVRSSLARGDELQYLAAEPDADWRMHLKQFDADAAYIESRANQSGIPVVAVLVPNREQAAILSAGSWPAGLDPYRFGNDLKSIVTSHGGIYLDILPSYRTAVNPEQGYFPVDGHPNDAGHAAIAQALADQLSGPLASELNRKSSAQSAGGKGR